MPSSGRTASTSVASRAAAERRELERGGRERALRLGVPLFELPDVERSAVDEIELRARHAQRHGDGVERRPVLLREAKDQIAPALHLGETRRIEIDGALVLIELARELLQ
jgi:hypothetical protein